jgi:hypothetical protein
MDMHFGILQDKNVSSTMRVGVIFPSLLVEIRLNATISNSLFMPSQKSSTEKAVSNLMKP